MKTKVYCPVCQVTFQTNALLETNAILICPVCGAKLQVETLEPQFSVRKFSQEPKDEIYERLDAFAKLRNFTFNEDKPDIFEGLLAKKEKYGDFYCPCRFDNVPENICPCLKTRQGEVVQKGKCY